jgi:hypothetical protein
MQIRETIPPALSGRQTTETETAYNREIQRDRAKCSEIRPIRETFGFAVDSSLNRRNKREEHQILRGRNLEMLSLCNFMEACGPFRRHESDHIVSIPAKDRR